MRKYGVREIVNVMFRAKSTLHLGKKTFYKGEPVYWFDSLTTSSLEGTSTSVYARGGRGNPQLVGWDGERELTFIFEDALISAESLAILSGAELVEATEKKPLYVHTTSQVTVEQANKIKLPLGVIPAWCYYAEDDVHYNPNATIYVMLMEEGQISSEPCIPSKITAEKIDGKTQITIECAGPECQGIPAGSVVFVDYYQMKTSGVTEMTIDAGNFAVAYYIEGDTLFRDEATGKDDPAIIVIPNGKVESNFTFSMASTGDPSTFTFTVRAMPGYTTFAPEKKVLAIIQVYDAEADADNAGVRGVCDIPVGETTGTMSFTKKPEGTSGETVAP